jgi:membrane protein
MLMRRRIKFGELIRETIVEWNRHNGSRLAAALAYYTVFSLAPLIVISIAIAGAVFGEDAARGEIVRQIEGLIGRPGAEVVQDIIQNTSEPSSNRLAAIFGIVTLFIGATGVFGQLQDALNQIWGVPQQLQQQDQRWWSVIALVIRRRFISFLMMLGTGFLLLVSLVTSTVLALIASIVGDLIPGFGFLTQTLNFIVSLGIVMLLLALIYKVVPDAPVAWTDVSLGAGITALLFTFGKLVIGLYLGNSTVASPYGAAGSLIVILIWVYYSAQILFLGAEFTQVYARRYGSHYPQFGRKIFTRTKSDAPTITDDVVEG